MEALDLSFIDYADGPNLVIGIDRLAYELNFDFEDLRKNLGFSRSTISRWCSATRTPRKSSREKICEYVKDALIREF